MRIACALCGKECDKLTGQVNRARRAGFRLFCNPVCAGIARRKGKTKEQKVTEMRDYNAAYREKNRAILKAKKHAYFKKTYDKEQAAIHRKTRMPYHVEYCRNPEYRKRKSKYDQTHRAKKDYDEFAEAVLVLRELELEINSRMTRYEVYSANETINKKLNRRREHARLISG